VASAGIKDVRVGAKAGIFIEKIILVDYRLSRERAVEIAKTLQSYWTKNNAPQSTLKIISRVRQEFELCSDIEYAQLKAQLYTKE